MKKDLDDDIRLKNRFSYPPTTTENVHGKGFFHHIINEGRKEAIVTDSKENIRYRNYLIDIDFIFLDLYVQFGEEAIKNMILFF